MPRRWTTGGGRFIFESNGNVVLYNKQNKAVWSSGSVAQWYDGKAKELRMQEDGDLVVIRTGSFGAEVVCWKSNTKGNQVALQVEWSSQKVRLVDRDGKVVKNLN